MTLIVCIYHDLFILSSVDGHLLCFPLWATVNSAAVNLGVHAIIWAPGLSFLNMHLGVELLSLMVILCLTFWGKVNFSVVLLTFLKNEVKDFILRHSLIFRGWKEVKIIYQTLLGLNLYDFIIFLLFPLFYLFFKNFL